LFSGNQQSITWAPEHYSGGGGGGGVNNSSTAAAAAAADEVGNKGPNTVGAGGMAVASQDGCAIAENGVGATVGGGDVPGGVGTRPASASSMMKRSRDLRRMFPEMDDSEMLIEGMLSARLSCSLAFWCFHGRLQMLKK
jgi:hypothetical protein